VTTVYVLLPVHNRRELTTRFVKTLARQTYPAIHLILIDDGSTDGTAQVVKEVFPHTSVITGAGDWWWAGGLQQGLNWLRAQRVPAADVVLMTNDDAVIGADFVEEGLEALTRLGGGLLQATILSLDGTHVLDQGMVFDEARLEFGPARADDEINCLTTNGLFCRWADVQRIGDFFPRLLPHYLSDYEYTIRAYKRGLKLRADRQVTLRWDRESSGYKDFSGDSYGRFLAKLFSKKCPINPVYRTTFVLLTCSWRYIPLHLVRVWLDASRLLLREALLRLSANR
jgi:GT2 family glycosyltransferase